MKSNLPIIISTIIITGIVVLIVEYFIFFGFNSDSKKALSIDSPDGLYNAYVMEKLSFDPPNQSLYISKNGENAFRLVEHLPGDIEGIQNIYWTPDGQTVVFVTNWHLIITNTKNFNTKKISLNPDWWKRHKKGTFISSRRCVITKKINFIGSDSLLYLTSEMSHPEKISIADL